MNTLGYTHWTTQGGAKQLSLGPWNRGSALEVENLTSAVNVHLIKHILSHRIGFKEGRSSSPAIDCQKGSEGILGPAPIQAINKKADLGHVQPHLTITNAGDRKVSAMESL